MKTKPLFSYVYKSFTNRLSTRLRRSVCSVAEFIENYAENINNISIYGQDANPTTRKLAIMNLAIHGIDTDLGSRSADTFYNDFHKTLKADFIMANPPFITGSNASYRFGLLLSCTGRFIEVSAFPAQRLAVNRFLLELIINIDEWIESAGRFIWQIIIRLLLVLKKKYGLPPIFCVAIWMLQNISM